MKLIQAVKILKEAGLTPELHYMPANKIPYDQKEVMSLFGMRRWYRETQYSSIEERDIVVCVLVEGASISRIDAAKFKADIEKGMAESRAREEKVNADRGNQAVSHAA